MSLSNLHRVLGLTAAFVVSATLSRANNWVVGSAAGPGVDFTNIQTAIDTVAAGDLLEVRPGSYGNFVLSKGLSIFGTAPGVSFTDVTIQNVAGGPRVQLAQWSCRKLIVRDCARIVVLDELAIVNTQTFQVVPSYGARVERCADVRMSRVTISSASVTRLDDDIVPALQVQDARVELVRCSLTGQSGAGGGQLESVSNWDFPGMPGSAAIELRANAIVHVALSQLRGGKGGDFGRCIDLCEPVVPGNGGNAIEEYGPNARVFVTGQPADSCRGGNAGAAYYWPSSPTSYGAPGRAVLALAGCTARVSGATFQAGGLGSSSTPTGSAFAGPGVITHLVPADPSLELLAGPHAAGDLVLFAVHAEPGSTVRLRYGRRPIVEDLPFSAEDRLVENLRAFNLGIVPPSGDVFGEVVINEDLPLGALIVFQAACTKTNGVTEMSQSLPLIVR